MSYKITAHRFVLPLNVSKLLTNPGDRREVFILVNFPDFNRPLAANLDMNSVILVKVDIEPE